MKLLGVYFRKHMSIFKLRHHCKVIKKKQNLCSKDISSTVHLWIPVQVPRDFGFPALICLALQYHYTPVFMSNSWWFCVSLTVRNSSHACVRSFDCSLCTKCTISCDLLISPFNSLVFLSSTAPLPLLITSFFFCPHLEKNKNKIL